MRKLLSSLLILLATVSFTFSSYAIQIDEKINEILNPVSATVVSIVFFSVEIFEGIKVPLIVVWLIVAAVFCTIYFGFVNIRHFGTAIKIFGSNEKNAPGEVSHKQALWTACAATVGLGNIAGVAIAVSLGGPGATFWMIVAGLLGMSLKFCECTLGVKYRVINEDGSISGGPMYYLSLIHI